MFTIPDGVEKKDDTQASSVGGQQWDDTTTQTTWGGFTNNETTQEQTVCWYVNVWSNGSNAFKQHFFQRLRWQISCHLRKVELKVNDERQ